MAVQKRIASSKVRQAYGKGTVTVSTAHLSPAARQQVRIAVNHWNRAAGAPVFRTVKKRGGDINATTNMPHRKAGEGGYGTLGRASVQKKNAGVKGNAYLWEHELGHALGLGHPKTPRTKTDPYGDQRRVMSSGYKPSKAEGRAAARITRTAKRKTK